MKKLLTALMLSSLVFAGCMGGGDVQDEERSEKDRFISASAEVTCVLAQAEELNAEVEAETKAIFEKNGFDITDEAGLQAIAERYKDDPDVETAITEALQECAGELMKAVEEMDAALEDLEAEDATTE